MASNQFAVREYMEQVGEGALVALRRILRVTESHARELARETGLTASQLIVLKMLASNGRSTAGTIAEKVGISQATVTVLLDKLEEQDLARRDRDTTDRRRVWVDLTDKGKTALSGAPDLLQDVFLDRFNQLPGWEQGYLLAALSKITYLLNAEQIDASQVLDVGAIDRGAADHVA